MKYHIFSIIICIYFICLTTSCETFGPATRYQNSRALERPFYNGVDTSQLYASARLGNGRNYREKDESFAGELSVHKSWVSELFYGSVGFYGQSGRYKLRDSSKALGYYSLGLRGEGGLGIYTTDTEVSVLTLSFSRSYESGAFYKLRKKVGLKDVSGLFSSDSTNASLPRSNWITDIQSYIGVRHRFHPNRVLGGRAGLGFSFNNEMAIYGFLDASLQIDEHSNVNFSLALPFFPQDENKIPIKLSNVFSMGFSYGF
jgi:hypothetical protein